MKVPVIVAAITAGHVDWEAIEAAITRSDTNAALRLWHELDDGAAQVEAVLSLPAAVRFYGALARGELLPSGETGRILDAMCRIVPEQRWGLGAADPPRRSRAAGARASPRRAATR
jgi:hypothetical protein